MTLLEQISTDLSIDSNFINTIAINSNRYYSKYNIKKHNGTDRKIYNPSPELKTLQYWLVYNVFNKCLISEFASAYSPGCSISKNAEKHKTSDHILHVDIKKFFESINKKHLHDLLIRNNSKLFLNDKDFELIYNICLYNNHLVTGSVCSPRISNCILYEFDMNLANQLSQLGNFIYTRYADDIIISSKNYINKDILNIVQNNLANYNFKVNFSKTYFMSKKGKLMVTGLLINNERLSIGYKRHKNIKKMLYKKLTNNEGDSDIILGNLAFLKDIEPDYFNKIIIKYSTYGDVLNILKQNKTSSYKKASEQAAASKL